MSVNVFGHSLNSKNTTVGYKLTTDGQLDVENQRLCNLAPPNEKKDAVNLETLQRMIKIENQHMLEITSKLEGMINNISFVT